MTRYQLAKKQVLARKNGNQGLFLFLFAVGGLYLAGNAVATQLSSLGHSLKDSIAAAINKGATSMARDDVQKVVEDVSEVSFNQHNKEKERD